MANNLKVKENIKTDNLKNPIMRLRSPVKRVKSPVKRLVDPIKSTKYEEILITEPKENYIDNKNKDTYYNIQLIDQIIDEIIKRVTITIPKEIKYVSNFFLTEITRWTNNSFIFINCGTGTGKTTFIENVIVLRKYKILVLTNRIANKMQINDHIERFGYNQNMVKIVSYQYLERNPKILSVELDKYDYIFLDEGHYFLSDIKFNQMANASFFKVLLTKKAIKVFLSATNEYICREVIKKVMLSDKYYINDMCLKCKIYKMEYNNSNITHIISFDDFNELINVIQNSNHKWLIFVRSLKEGQEYLELLKKQTEKSVAFIYREGVDSDELDSSIIYEHLVYNERFEEDILISTSIIDNGVNIKDKELKNIISFESNYVELLQEIGRKRCIDDSDDFKLYLFNIDKKSLSGSIQQKNISINNFLKIKESLKIRTTIDPTILLNNAVGNAYREAIYINHFEDKIDFNYLGLTQLLIEKIELENLKASSSAFQLKANWISSRLIKKPTILDDKNTRYMRIIDKYLNISIEKSDNQSRKYICNSFMKIYGKDNKNEKMNRHFGLKKLKEKYNKESLPIKIIEEKDTFKLVNEQVNKTIEKEE